MDYRQSGVDIDAGNETVRRIKSLARGTFTPGVLSEIGSFGGLFRLDRERYREPVLVSSADGVGTKLKVAFMTGRHDTVGADLVNHCVNDILVQGAEPLFFLDYLATGRLSPDVAEQVVAGVARGCRENGCALIGGETAEMPGFYADGEYDIAGFIVGVVEQSKRDRRHGDRAGRRADRRCRRRACTPTATRWRGACSSRSPGWQPDTFVAGARARRSATRCSRRTGRICALVRPLLERRLGQGHGAHHRRRHHREPAADPARGLRARRSTCARGRCRRSSGCCSSAARSRRDEMFRAFNMGIGLDRRLRGARTPSACIDMLAARRRAATPCGIGDRRRRRPRSVRYV